MNTNTLKMPQCVTGFQLKVIAVVSMLIDHLATVLLANLLAEAAITGYGFVFENQEILWNIYNVMRWAGRLAFPLYCFLLVEGFTHTKNKGKYAFRLFLFALISEVPFDMAFSECILERYYNNVFFTLFLAFVMIWLISVIKDSLSKIISENKIFLRNFVYIAAILLCYRVFAYLADFVFWSDYDSSGLLVVLTIYLLRNKPVLGQTVACLLLTVLSLAFYQLFGLLTVPLIMMYSGERGPSMKYAFYLFYPVHLLILTGLGIAFGAIHLQGIIL